MQMVVAVTAAKPVSVVIHVAVTVAATIQIIAAKLRPLSQISFVLTHALLQTKFEGFFPIHSSYLHG